jgi:hypothetical protein
MNLKLETWNFKHWHLCKAYERFSMRMFKTATDFINFQQSFSVQYIISPICLHLYIILWIVFSIWKCKILTRYFDTSSNATDLMFNTVVGAWNYGWQAYTTKAIFIVRVQRFTGAILKRRCYINRLLACKLCQKSKHAVWVSCTCPARPAEWFSRLQKSRGILITMV